MDSPFTYTPISDEYTEEMIKNSNTSVHVEQYTIVNPYGYFFPSKYQKSADRIRNFQVYPDDTWVVTFPKCGTTWTQEMVWLLKNNFDFHTAKTTELRFRMPFFEFETIVEFPENETPPTIDKTEQLARPRCIKSHLPMELLPKQLWTVKPKIIVVMRDPRDVAISLYHHVRLFNGYQGTIEKFVDIFLNDRVTYGPYWSHVLSFLDLPDKSHILFNTYEEMKKDLEGVIRKTAKFLNVEVTDEKVAALKEHISFKNMRDNKMVNCSDSVSEAKKRMNAENDENLNFIRKGESGGWKNTFGNEILDKFKNWNEKYLKNKDFKEYPWA